MERQACPPSPRVSRASTPDPHANGDASDTAGDGVAPVAEPMTPRTQRVHVTATIAPEAMYEYLNKTYKHVPMPVGLAMSPFLLLNFIADRVLEAVWLCTKARRRVVMTAVAVGVARYRSLAIHVVVQVAKLAFRLIETVNAVANVYRESYISLFLLAVCALFLVGALWISKINTDAITQAKLDRASCVVGVAVPVLGMCHNTAGLMWVCYVAVSMLLIRKTRYLDQFLMGILMG